MDNWKYCPHCGKELMTGAPKPQDAWPIINPIYPQPSPQIYPNPWNPITTWNTNTSTGPTVTIGLKADDH